MTLAPRRTLDHVTGCLLGGAVGDALGAPVEFLTIDEIRAKYGPQGIKDYDVAYGRRGAITDDTQMTLFTAEGMLRAISRWNHKGICHPPTVIHGAYLRWLQTQHFEHLAARESPAADGWLIRVAGLHHRRAPGRTCVTALEGRQMGTIEAPLNDSKGCGGVMRAAPIGLVSRDLEAAFSLGCESAAITHGHPSGYYSAGALAAIVHQISEGRSLLEAIDDALRLLTSGNHHGHGECADAIRGALTLWRDRSITPSPEAIAQLGRGWVGEEALAISLYCALHAGDDFARGVLLAVNHSGDSDSTGAIAGNILGVMLGKGGIPARWLEGLELGAEIETIGRDLHQQFDESDAWWERYPGW